jgi:hypothetical protein
MNFTFTDGTAVKSVSGHTVTILCTDPDNVAHEWATSAPGGAGIASVRCVVTNGTTVNICKAGTYQMQGYVQAAGGLAWKTEIVEVIVEANLA